MEQDAGGGIYRSRLGSASSEATRYVSSIREDTWIFNEDIECTVAHDLMLMEQGYITEEQLKRILEALKRLRDEGLSQIDLEKYEDVHELIESYVVKQAGIEVGGLVHTARSRNDQVVTAVRLKTRREVLSIMRELLELEEALLKKAGETVDVVFPFYTHLQQAQAAPLSHYFLGYFDMFLRDFNRLSESFKRVNQNPLGSVAIVGSSLKIDRGLTTRLLGFDGVLENSFDAVSSRDFALEVVSNLNILMLNLSRIMEDLIIWLSSEYGFFTLPDELAFPSSAMPNKKNPCILELTRARTGRVFSSLAQLSMVCKAVPSGYVRDLQETKPPLIEAIETTREAVRIVRVVLENLRENRERIRSLTEPSIIALDVSERIVEEGKIPFRLAHRLVGEMVKLSVKTGRRMTSFNEDDLRMVSMSVLGRDMSSLLASILKEADTGVLVSKRVSLGAGSPEADKMMLAARRNVLQECFSKFSLLIRKDREARLLLEDSVSRLVAGFSFSKD